MTDSIIKNGGIRKKPFYSLKGKSFPNGETHKIQKERLTSRIRHFNPAEASAFIAPINAFMEKCGELTAQNFITAALQAEKEGIDSITNKPVDDSSLTECRGKTIELLAGEERSDYIDFLYSLASCYSHLAQPELSLADNILGQINVREGKDYLAQIERGIVRTVKSFKNGISPFSQNFPPGIDGHFETAFKILLEKKPDLNKTEEQLVWEGKIYNLLVKAGKISSDARGEDLATMLKILFENSGSSENERLKDFYFQKMTYVIQCLKEKGLPLSSIAYAFGQAQFEGEIQIEDLGPLRTFLFVDTLFKSFGSIGEVYGFCGGKNNPVAAERATHYYIHLKMEELKEIDSENTTKEALFNTLKPLFVCPKEIADDKQYWSLLSKVMHTLIEKGYTLEEITHVFCMPVPKEREVEKTEIYGLGNAPARLSLITLLLAGRRNAQKAFIPIQALKNNLHEKEAVLYMIGRINWIMTDEKIPNPSDAALQELRAAKSAKEITPREFDNLKSYKNDLAEKTRKKREVLNLLAGLKNGEIRYLPAAVNKVINAFAEMPELEYALAGKVPAIIREMLAVEKIKEAAYLAAELLRIHFPAGEEIKKIFAEELDKTSLQAWLKMDLQKNLGLIRKSADNWSEYKKDPHNLSNLIEAHSTHNLFFINFKENPAVRKIYAEVTETPYAEPVAFPSFCAEVLADCVENEGTKKEFLEKAVEEDPQNLSAQIKLSSQLSLDNEFARAEEILFPLIEEQPEKPTLRFEAATIFLGNLAGQMGRDPQETEEIFKHITKFHSQIIQFYPEAKARHPQPEEVKRQLASAWCCLADAYHKKNDLQKAEEVLKNAFRLDPQNPNAVTLQGKILFKTGFINSAITIISKAVTPQRLNEYSPQLAFYLFCLGDYQKALEFARNIETPSMYAISARALNAQSLETRYAAERATGTGKEELAKNADNLAKEAWSMLAKTLQTLKKETEKGNLSPLKEHLYSGLAALASAEVESGRLPAINIEKLYLTSLEAFSTSPDLACYKIDAWHKYVFYLSKQSTEEVGALKDAQKIVESKDTNGGEAIKAGEIAASSDRILKGAEKVLEKADAFQKECPYSPLPASLKIVSLINLSRESEALEEIKIVIDNSQILTEEVIANLILIYGDSDLKENREKAQELFLLAKTKVKSNSLKTLLARATLFPPIEEILKENPSLLQTIKFLWEIS